MAVAGGALMLGILLAVATWILNRPNPSASDDVSAELPSSEAPSPAPAQAVADKMPSESAATLPSAAQTAVTQPPTIASPPATTAAEPNLTNYSGFTSWALSADTAQLVTCAVEQKREGSKLIGFIGALAVWDTVTGKQLRALMIQEDCRMICLSPDGKHVAFAHPTDPAVASDWSLAIFDR